MISLRNGKAFIIATLLLLTIGCSPQEADQQSVDFDQEKIAVLATINGETKAAFNRNYQDWQAKWVHEPYVSKTYMNFQDSSLSETLGWTAINAFVKTYLEAHPEPAPLPDLVDSINLRLYGNGAWAEYQQLDPERGLKRETRLLEKVDGQWKIAGMQTVIYGFPERK